MAGFRLQRAVDTAVDVGAEISETEDGHHFCLSYHLKDVCNSNCGGRHFHWTLLKGKFAHLTECQDMLCRADAHPEVEEVNAMAGTVVRN